MTMYKRFSLAVLAVVVIAAGVAGASLTVEPQRHVVGENEIQARIDQQIVQADADRQAIQIMLQRADVRQIAGSAGLDLERASAAAAVLSGPHSKSWRRRPERSTPASPEEAARS